jgi:hypothetical protein
VGAYGDEAAATGFVGYQGWPTTWITLWVRGHVGQDLETANTLARLEVGRTLYLGTYLYRYASTTSVGVRRFRYPTFGVALNLGGLFTAP